MKRPNQCPPIPPALLDYMARRYEKPITAINGNTPDRQVGVLIGNAQVIEWMRKQLEDQNKNNTVLTT